MGRGRSTRSAVWPRAPDLSRLRRGRPLTERSAATPPDPAGDDAPVPRLGDLVLAALLYAGALFVAAGLIGPELTARGESEPRVFLALQLVDDAALAGTGLLFGRLRFPGAWAALGLRRVGVGWWAWGLGAGVMAAVAAWLVGLLLSRWGWSAPVHPVEAVLGEARGGLDVALVLTAVAVAVPFAEEVFFRGFAYRLLRARLGRGVATGATSLGFALVHGLGPASWAPVVPVGIIFALLVEHSGSLWPAVAGHAVVNGVAVLVH